MEASYLHSIPHEPMRPDSPGPKLPAYLGGVMHNAAFGWQHGITAPAAAPEPDDARTA